VATFTVVYDACLFYPAPLRDLMIRLAQTRRFRARWTEAIQREWLTALLRNRPELDEAKLARTMTFPTGPISLMRRAWTDPRQR